MTFLVYGQNDINDTLTVLPFDLGEWVKWQDAIDMTEMEDDGRYKSMLLSENENLRQLIDKTYPNYINTHYFILKSNKTDCVVYIVISVIKNETGLYFNLVNFQRNEKIASLSLGGLFGAKKERKNFIITKDLEITLFDEKFFYSEKEERTIVTEKKKTGTYRIQKNGKVIEIK